MLIILLQQEEEFRKYRELVRENLHKISEANNKLEEINRTKEMTDRKSAKYIELLHEEHHTAVKREELIKEQEHLEKKERDSFSDLTRVTQDAREQTNIAGRNFGYFYMTVYVVTYLAMNHIHTKRNEKHVEDLSNMVKGTHAKSTEQLQYIVDKMDMLVNNTYLEETHSPPNNAQESIAKLISTITALQNNMESLQREIQSIRIVQKEITGMPSNTETAKPTVGHSFRIKNENQMSVEVPVEETGSNSQKYIKGAICVGSMVAAVAVLANWLNRS